MLRKAAAVNRAELFLKVGGAGYPRSGVELHFRQSPIFLVADIPQPRSIVVIRFSLNEADDLQMFPILEFTSTFHHELIRRKQKKLKTVFIFIHINTRIEE